MARPLRDTSAEKVHLITTRTASAELLLVPHFELNAILGGILARYAERFSIEVFAYVILSNHYHLLVRGPEALLPRFIENLNREIAHRVNRYLGRKNSIWGRRYDDQVTIEAYDAVEGMLYIATNPVKHGMVQHPKHWPGLSCYRQLISETARDFYFTHHTKYQKARRRAEASGELVRISDYQTKHTLRLTPLPLYAGLGLDERTARVEQLIEQRTEKLVRERRAAGKGFLGRKAVLRQPRQKTFPEEVSNSPRPPCYTKNPEAGRVFVEEEKARRELYQEASYRYRCGELNVAFPPNCFRPPLHHLPKYLVQPAPD